MTDIQRNSGGPYCAECGVSCCEHVASATKFAKIFLSSAPAIFPLGQEDIDDLKSMIRKEWIDTYKGGAVLARESVPAARILVRHGITVHVDSHDGKITFSDAP